MIDGVVFMLKDMYGVEDKNAAAELNAAAVTSTNASGAAAATGKQADDDDDTTECVVGLARFFFPISTLACSKSKRFRCACLMRALR